MNTFDTDHFYQGQRLSKVIEAKSHPIFKEKIDIFPDMMLSEVETAKEFGLIVDPTGELHNNWYNLHRGIRAFLVGHRQVMNISQQIAAYDHAKRLKRLREANAPNQTRRRPPRRR
jgi:hypothetical protein